jgi:hypothetical protein
MVYRLFNQEIFRHRWRERNIACEESGFDLIDIRKRALTILPTSQPTCTA